MFGSGLCWHKPTSLYLVTALAAHPVPLWTLQPLELGGTCVCTFSPHPAMRADAVDLQLETLRHHAANLGRSFRPDGMLCQRHLLSIYPK